MAAWVGCRNLDTAGTPLLLPGTWGPAWYHNTDPGKSGAWVVGVQAGSKGPFLPSGGEQHPPRDSHCRAGAQEGSQQENPSLRSVLCAFMAVAMACFHP